MEINTTDITITHSVLKGVGRFFYVINPKETSFNDENVVPDFFRQSWPYFLAFIFIENIILFLEGRPTIRINDGITSLSHGILHQCGKLVFRGAENALYIYIYDRFRLCDLAWDAASTWYLAALAVDFCYYWVHRASHEVHILWAQHQVHHSSEDYNLAVGLRQSVLHSWCGFVFYLPMALVVPPSHFLTHQQFSLMFQFWLHTKAVDHLGPLEWILNTPRHHRVHHGCNLYCLDKNYGGVLIIWDRIFGTFQDEKPKDELIYGLVLNQPSFNPLYLQTFYTAHVVNKWRNMDNWKDKVWSVLKGPSWIPGSPIWTGRQEDKIDVQPREKFDVQLPLWCNIYLLVHFAVVVLGFQELCIRHVGMSQLTVLGFVGYILLSLTTIGLMLENQPQARAFELVRCLVFATWLQRSTIMFSPLATWALQAFFAVSAAFWALQSMQIRLHHKEA